MKVFIFMSKHTLNNLTLFIEHANYYEKFEDIKGVIRSCKSPTERQYTS